MTVSYDDAAREVRSRAGAVAELLAAPLTEPYLNPTACLDPQGRASETGVYYLHSSYTLPVGADRVADALQLAYRHFAAEGYQVSDIDWFNGGGGRVRAESPDGYRYSLTSTMPPVAIALGVHSPCFQAPAGEVARDRWLPPS
jgi:hypothetical protein